MKHKKIRKLHNHDYINWKLAFEPWQCNSSTKLWWLILTSAMSFILRINHTIHWWAIKPYQRFKLTFCFYDLVNNWFSKSNPVFYSVDFFVWLQVATLSMFMYVGHQCPLHLVRFHAAIFHSKNYAYNILFIMTRITQSFMFCGDEIKLVNYHLQNVKI